jgi:hypothetical protein
MTSPAKVDANLVRDEPMGKVSTHQERDLFSRDCASIEPADSSA